MSSSSSYRCASVETRFHGSAPLFKAYIINGSDVFFGYYPAVRHQVRVDGKRETIFDPMGKDAVMFQHTDPDSLGSQFVCQTRDWFTSIWGTIAVPR